MLCLACSLSNLEYRQRRIDHVNLYYRRSNQSCGGHWYTIETFAVDNVIFSWFVRSVKPVNLVNLVKHSTAVSAFHLREREHMDPNHATYLSSIHTHLCREVRTSRCIGKVGTLFCGPYWRRGFGRFSYTSHCFHYIL